MHEFARGSGGVCLKHDSPPPKKKQKKCIAAPEEKKQSRKGNLRNASCNGKEKGDESTKQKKKGADKAGGSKEGIEPSGISKPPTDDLSKQTLHQANVDEGDKHGQNEQNGATEAMDSKGRTKASGKAKPSIDYLLEQTLELVHTPVVHRPSKRPGAGDQDGRENPSRDPGESPECPGDDDLPSSGKLVLEKGAIDFASVKKKIDAQCRMIDMQRKTIDAQRKTIDAQRHCIADRDGKIMQLNHQLGQSTAENCVHGFHSYMLAEKDRRVTEMKDTIVHLLAALKESRGKESGGNESKEVKA